MLNTLALDFVYAGERLSTNGYMICSFDGASDETRSAGSEISFNLVSQQGGSKYGLASVSYDSYYSVTFDICKSDGTDISVSEMRDVMQWLNRKELNEFYLIEPRTISQYETSLSDLIFFGSFNVSRIDFAGRLIGFELTLVTDRPFAVGDSVSATVNAQANSPFVIDNKSDEIGFLYPESFVVTFKGTTGDTLTITNSTDERQVVIHNCTYNEVITMDCFNQIISSSLSSHNIYNDFNYNFFRISRTRSSTTNTITTSAPCTVSYSYRPIRKAVF